MLRVGGWEERGEGRKEGRRETLQRLLLADCLAIPLYRQTSKLHVRVPM